MADAHSSVHHFALYPKDFLADAGHLGNTELGIYFRLLLHYYRDRKPLPYDTDRIRRLAMCMTPEEFRALEFVLTEFFGVDARPDGTRVWTHRRADAEIERAHRAYDAAVERARLMNERRKKKQGLSTSVVTTDERATSPQRTKARTSVVSETEPDKNYATLVLKGQPDGSPQPGVAALDPAVPSKARDSDLLQNPKAPTTTEGTTRAKAPAPESPSGRTWEAYRAAYLTRYGVEPVRNATVNAQLKALVARLGAEEAPAVASYYVGHGKATYVARRHSVGLLLMDAEALRTDWATKTQATHTQALLADRSGFGNDQTRRLFGDLAPRTEDDGMTFDHQP